MLKILAAIVAIRDLFKYLAQFVELVRGAILKREQKGVEKAVDDLKKAESVDDKKDALRRIADDSF